MLCIGKAEYPIYKSTEFSFFHSPQKRLQTESEENCSA